MKIVSKILSWLFLPLLAPVYAVVIAMYTESWEADFYQGDSLFSLDERAKEFFLYLFTSFSFLAPALTVLFLQTRGSVTTVMMEKRTERIIPAIMTVLFGISLLAILLFKVPHNLPGARFIFGLSFGSLIAVVVCTALTFRWKVSLHAAGMGILTGFLYMYYSKMLIFPMWILMLAFIASGIVMSARMYLKLHSLSQLVIGFAIGFAGLVLGIQFFFRYY
ncbi:phosphatase PAP2 family protein [Fluviicola sp.]|uniref:phosphatase PAP2 family protein n=1 Tax=Fluviicola sp. TaxID=1917219 RepID=UPI0031D24391